MHIRMAALVILTATQAGADAGYYNKTRMTLLPAQDACFAVIEIKNTVGNYNETETLTTAFGDVLVQYTTIGGHNPDDHDLVDVADLPNGVMAVPLSMSLPDGDTGYICLLERVSS